MKESGGRLHFSDLYDYLNKKGIHFAENGRAANCESTLRNMDEFCMLNGVDMVAVLGMLKIGPSDCDCQLLLIHSHAVDPEEDLLLHQEEVAEPRL